MNQALPSLPGDSRPVESNQEGVHRDLEEVVRKHLVHPYRKPIAAHTRAAFLQAQTWVKAAQKPLVLDSGCGTGESSVLLAARHTDCCVMGIDKSEVRLDKTLRKELPENLLLLRADVVDFWLLAHEMGWHLAAHYLFYPNPWPKSRHLFRRWHAHPVFPTLLALGGRLELRTNWKIYAEEFAMALHVATNQDSTCSSISTQDAVSPFERKYTASGHALWQMVAQLNP